MADNPVLRINSDRECGLPVGQINIKLQRMLGSDGFETISFYCNQLKNHHDLCHFDGKEVIVYRRTR